MGWIGEHPHRTREKGCDSGLIDWKLERNGIFDCFPDFLLPDFGDREAKCYLPGICSAP